MNWIRTQMSTKRVSADTERSLSVNTVWLVSSTRLSPLRLCFFA